MPKLEPIDLIIVGAGPAGLSTALHLLQQDPSWQDRLLLLEKETHPRPKLCGGGVTRVGLMVLQDLGFSLPPAIPHTRVDNVSLNYRKRTIQVRGKPMFLVFDRPEFDHYLVQEAVRRGARIQEQEAVQSIALQQDHVLVQSTHRQYRAKMIVGADGTTGPVSRAFKGTRETQGISRTLETWSPVISPSALFSQLSARFDFDFLSQDLQGYFWEFPSILKGERGHNYGVYDSRLARTRSRSNLLAVIKNAASPVLSEESFETLQGAPIHWFDPANKISAHRVLLVGDAAGVEVLFGEGISPALYYGKVAARVITAAFRNQDFHFSTYRKQIMTSRLGRYLFIRRLLASYLYNLGHRPFFSHLFWTVGQILATIWRGYRLY